MPKRTSPHDIWPTIGGETGAHLRALAQQDHVSFSEVLRRLVAREHCLRLELGNLVLELAANGHAARPTILARLASRKAGTLITEAEVAAALAEDPRVARAPDGSYQPMTKR